MKKLQITGLIFVIAAFAMQISAQNDNVRGKEGRKPFDKDVFIAKRNAYITEKVGLTAEEAAVFIPMENELLQKKFEAGHKCHELERSLRHKKNRSEEEFKALLKCREEVKEKQDQLDKDYLEKFKKVLSSEKILKYQSADREFFNEFMSNRRESGPRKK